MVTENGDNLNSSPLICFIAVLTLSHDLGWMYCSDESNQAGVCKHRGEEHGPAEGSAWIAREQNCGVWAGWAGRSGQAPRVSYCPAITRQVHGDKQGWDQAREAACVSGSVRGAGGQAQAQSIAHVGDKKLWLSLKTACVRKGNRHQWSIPTAPSEGSAQGH